MTTLGSASPDRYERLVAVAYRGRFRRGVTVAAGALRWAAGAGI